MYECAEAESNLMFINKKIFINIGSNQFHAAFWENKRRIFQAVVCAL